MTLRKHERASIGKTKPRIPHSFRRLHNARVVDFQRLQKYEGER